MRTSKVLVTGGTGFVGHWLRETQPEDYEGTYMSREDYACSLWPIPHYYIHAAPVPPTQVLDFAAKYGGRVLYVSSGAVYEQDTEYAEAKRRGEQECLDSGLNVVIARLFTFYGDKLDSGKAFTQFTKAAKAGETIHVWGDGNTVRSYMHGSEMGFWLWAILRRGQNGEAYDVGLDVPVTMMELARGLNTAYGNRSKIVVENKPEVSTYYMPRDTGKTRRLLNDG